MISKIRSRYYQVILFIIFQLLLRSKEQLIILIAIVSTNIEKSFAKAKKAVMDYHNLGEITRLEIRQYVDILVEENKKKRWQIFIRRLSTNRTPTDIKLCRNEDKFSTLIQNGVIKDNDKYYLMKKMGFLIKKIHKYDRFRALFHH